MLDIYSLCYFHKCEVKHANDLSVLLLYNSLLQDKDFTNREKGDSYFCVVLGHDYC